MPPVVTTAPRSTTKRRSFRTAPSVRLLKLKSMEARSLFELKSTRAPSVTRTVPPYMRSFVPWSADSERSPASVHVPAPVFRRDMLLFFPVFSLNRTAPAFSSAVPAPGTASVSTPSALPAENTPGT